MMGFEMSEYFFSESAGILSQSVYIVRENEVTVSSTFTVTVVLLESTATDGKLHPENIFLSLIYIISTISSIGSDFTVPDGFNVTITFGGLDARQPFPIRILEDVIGEGDEIIQLQLTTPGDLDGVRPGLNDTTTIVIVENDCKSFSSCLEMLELTLCVSNQELIQVETL